MKFFKAKDRFLYLTILVFIVVSSTALSLSGQVPKIVQNFQAHAESEKTFPPVPVLSQSATFPIISGEGAIAVDLTSGINLYEKNPDKSFLPASTTKIITALVAMDVFSPDQVLKVGKVRVEGQKMGLFAGEEMRFEDLLYGLLVYSANDAAEVLAENFPGGRDTFIIAMNEKAKNLSMRSTFFQNPVGLDGNLQVTTARDLVRASEVAMKIPEFAKIVGTPAIIVKDVSGKNVYSLKNINQLVGKIPGVIGVKTGWTENARENLVTYLERDGHKIMIVVLGSQDRFGETTELIDWIFENYEWQEVNPYSP